LFGLFAELFLRFATDNWVLFGFAGLHFTDDGIVQMQPCLPAEWTSLTITGFGKNNDTVTITHDGVRLQKR